MTPHVRDSVALATARDELRAQPAVVDVDVVETPPHRGAVVEVVVDPAYDRVPPAVLKTLCRNDLGVRDASAQGEPGHLIAICV